MIRYLIRRILLSFPTLIGISVVVFLLFNGIASPDQIARQNISSKNPTKQQIEQWKKDKGYDRPLQERMARHLTETTLFRFGKSDSSGEDIWKRIREGAPVSFTVMGLILVAGLITDISLALLLAYFRGTYVDWWGTTLCVLLMSISYIVYLIGGQFILAKVLRFFPVGGYQEGLGGLKFFMMPMVVGTIGGLGSAVRLYRTFFLDEINQDYVRTARAKGVSEPGVLTNHVLKNAAIPIITSVVQQIPLLIFGGVLTETFFNLPGLGSYLVDAINSSDFAVVRAMVYLGGALYILGQIMTDVAYALADPRIRLE